MKTANTYVLHPVDLQAEATGSAPISTPGQNILGWYGKTKGSESKRAHNTSF
jgi:hypothetical protein